MTDDDVTAINRLGVTVPYGRAVMPFVGVTSGRPYCRTCKNPLRMYRTCAECGQMHHWEYVHRVSAANRTWCPPVPKEEIEYLDKWNWEATPTRHLVGWALVITELELKKVTKAEELDVTRPHTALVRELATKELDRRSRRGIEDE